MGDLSRLVPGIRDRSSCPPENIVLGRNKNTVVTCPSTGVVVLAGWKIQRFTLSSTRLRKGSSPFKLLALTTRPCGATFSSVTTQETPITLTGGAIISVRSKRGGSKGIIS